MRNAFRPKTTSELLDAFHDAQEDTSIGVVLVVLPKAQAAKTAFGLFAAAETKKRVDTKAMWAKTDTTD